MIKSKAVADLTDAVQHERELRLSELLEVRELEVAPDAVRRHLLRVPTENQILLEDSEEAYLARGIVGPGSRSDALHVALATVGRVDVFVSWNFRHIVNLCKIRMFNAVSFEWGYGLLEIRTPKEVLDYE